MTLPEASALAAGLALSFYVLLDGFDLGVGALLPFACHEADRDRMVASVAPVWDGNETWLIMAGIILLGGFPAAYGVLMPAFYLPLVVMLLSPGLRGVSFEFRFQTIRRRLAWDVAFAGGSIVAASMQGLVLGGLLQGVAVAGDRFAGNVTDLLRPLPVITAAAVLAGYVILSAGWLHLKTDAGLRTFAERALRRSAGLFAPLIVVTCATAAWANPAIARQWLEHPVGYAVIAIALAALLVGLLRAIGRSAEGPLAFTSGLFALGLVGAGSLIYPYVVPYSLSVTEAASPNLSQTLILAGVAIAGPMVLAYNAFAYYVFRGPTPSAGWEE